MKRQHMKPKKVVVSDKEYIEKLVNVGLVKELDDNVAICSYCHGTGLIIKNETIIGLNVEFQFIDYCPYCYHGVVQICELCGGIIQHGYYKHDCKQQKILDEKERKQREEKEFLEAELLPKDKEKCYEYYYSSLYTKDNGLFDNWNDFFENWYNNHDDCEVRPEYVWVTDIIQMYMDAKEIVRYTTDDLYEDAIEDISDKDIRKLQEMLDKWVDNCGINRTYCESHRYKVKIPWEKYKNKKEKR